ncbi:LysR family transcriptional regulator [Cellvibrio sp. KY-GH-1]|uniref:LysR family transcriptional regulator n=1 Tax=Cellvibrio sp. KY-GH-1 TaxID=2303332 RepID=UPI0012466C10|nr:LysR family transcriptional regulator [Cellvibrio sp. KY-GH-1]QEY16347.1 LysR family transcriptional regulator [Cellvibrio sp. KY-GH-1]
MDRFVEMQVFVAVAETEGFASGSRKLGISPPVATRAVADLEARLGVKLLTRTTRYVRVTDAGKRYLEDCKRILSEITEADDAAAGINGEPSGHIAITAPVVFGRMYVQPGVIEYLNRYPKMDLSALYVDRVVNLLEEGLDVGIRVGELADSSMRAIRVGTVRRVLCASPDYLARMGIPKTPEDLLEHTIASASGVNPNVEWKFNQEQTVRIRPRLNVSTNDAAIDSAVAGFGIARQMSYQIAKQLERGELKIILSDYELSPSPIHILHREGRHASAKIRCFVDLMVEQLRADKSLN